MVIDLNDPRYLSDGKLTKEDILRKFSEEEIFRHYVGDFELGVPIKSPLRATDDNPSFNIFYSKRHNCLLFKDFAGKRGDCVKLVQEILGISSYQKALEQILKDMSFKIPEIDNKPSPTTSKKKKSKLAYVINIVIKEWDTASLQFWERFGISLPILKMFNVYPISGYYHNMYYVDTPELAFAFVEYKDNTLTYKIYRPFADKLHKWRNNNPFSVHQGYAQLPATGDLLIITKSLKDVMSIYEVAKISAVGVQAETCFIKESVMDEYKTRFERVVTLFDNDEQGKEQAKLYKNLYEVEPIFIPERYLAKDFSDLVELLGRYNASRILNNLLNNSL